MKKRLILLALTLVTFAGLLFVFTLPAAAAEGDLPTSMWVAPSDTNGIPAQIDVFVSNTSTSTSGNWSNRITTTTYTCQLYLPGNAAPENCYLSWADGMTVDNDGYASGECPAPAPNKQVTYTFTKGKTIAKFVITTYQGSASVTPVFIVIDEKYQTDDEPWPHTIAKMKASKDNTCSGDIYINGTKYHLDKMKGRGNATWIQAKDKKPYNITLDTKIIFPGVDSAKTKKWSFLAEVLDRSLLCNRSGYHLAYELGIGQDTTSADVWMNGEYQGCYTVTPKTDSFVTKNGYMIEQDNYKEDPVADGGDPQFTLDGLEEYNGNWSSVYNRITVKKMGDNLLLNNGVVDESPENMEAAAAEIQSWLQEAWDAIRSDKGYNKQGKYYTEYIDIESFAKMYLMHEYVKSYDVCAGSILFHRDGNTDADKLIAGPLWDLDNAMGSVYQNGLLGNADDRRNGDRRSAEGYFIPNITEYKTSIYKTISKHEDFMEEVERQYNIYKWAFDSLENDTAKMISDIEASATMNHVKVTDIGNDQGKNNHYYKENTTLGSDDYRQVYVKTSNWANYAANLKTYIQVRSLWLADHYYDPTFVDPTTCNHQYQETVVPATCTADGSATYTCPICGHSYTDTLPKIAHDYQDGVCTVCGQKLINVIIACDNGASVTVYKTKDITGEYIDGATIVHPRDGVTGLIDCYVDSDGKGSGQVNFMVNHDPCCELTSVTAEPASSYTSLKEIDEDTHLYRLTKVNDHVTITVKTSSAHDYQAVVTEPTCTAGGYTTYTCSKCGDSYTSSETTALGHDWGEWTQIVAPTYTTKGEERRTCSRCGATETHEIAALGHNYVAVVTEPTCTAGGYTTYTCSDCGDSYVTDETSALGHNWGEWTQTKAPTCAAPGEKRRTCSRCNETETQEIAKLEHEYVAVVTAPTCAAEGYTTHTCSNCGDSYVDASTPRIPHTYVDGVCTVCKTKGTTVKYVNLTLSGEIGLNFKLDIPDDIKNAEGSKAVITYKGADTEFPLSSATKNNQGLYVFTQLVSAKEIANSVTIKVVDANGISYDLFKSDGKSCTNNEYSSSVTNYCTRVASGNNDAKLKALAKALQNYGHYAHALFKSNDTTPKLASNVNMSGITANSLSNFAIKKSGTISGIKLSSMFLSLKSETDINLRFTLEEGQLISDYTFICNGKTLTPTVSDGTYVVKIPNIAAKDLDTEYTLTVQKGSSKQTIKCSALSYAYLVLKNSPNNKDLCNTVKSLKLYNDAANAYFGK